MVYTSAYTEIGVNAGNVTGNFELTSSPRDQMLAVKSIQMAVFEVSGTYDAAIFPNNVFQGVLELNFNAGVLVNHNVFNPNGQFTDTSGRRALPFTNVSPWHGYAVVTPQSGSNAFGFIQVAPTFSFNVLSDVVVGIYVTIGFVYL